MRGGLFCVVFLVALGLSAQRYDAAVERPVGVSLRPAVENRCFRSKAVDDCIEKTCKKISDPKLRWMFENCFPNTLDTTVKLWGEDDSFVITGDIPAMWLRDSAAQVWPYLRFCKDDRNLAKLVRGLIRRQLRSLLLDPYANAFNLCPDSMSPNWQDDLTLMKRGVFERKYELDSQCYPFRLAMGYVKATGDGSILDDLYEKALAKVKSVMEYQRRRDWTHEEQFLNGYDDEMEYQFMRVTHAMHDTQSNRGMGHPGKPCGLIASAFRPSDDATIFPYLIPSNLMAAQVMLETGDTAFANEIRRAVEREAIVNHPKYGRIYAYEVDGFGNHLLMDDANVPSLLSLPYIAPDVMDRDVYENTRRFVLSDDNPYYFQGVEGSGIGGPHVGVGAIWPMSVIMQALTSDDGKEIDACIEMLKNTDGGMGQIHESFSRDTSKKYTRGWFAWANTLFGELIYNRIWNRN